MTLIFPQGLWTSPLSSKIIVDLNIIPCGQLVRLLDFRNFGMSTAAVQHVATIPSVLLPRAHAQGGKVIGRVVVVVNLLSLAQKSTYLEM